MNSLLFLGALLSVALAQTEPPHATTSAPTESAMSEPLSIEDSLQLRDPFRMPVRYADPTQADANVPELQRYSVEQFRIVGIITGPKKARALLASPNNRMFIVQENDKIGVHKGFIKKIKERSLTVREKIVNLLGQEENTDVELVYQGQKGSGSLQSQQQAQSTVPQPQGEEHGTPPQGPGMVPGQ